MPHDDFLFFASSCNPPPKIIGDNDKLAAERSGKSIDSSINAEDKASPYKAEYPPVLNTVPLNKKGENLPRVARSGMLVRYGLFTSVPSINCFVSAPVPPRTNNPSCSPTC